MRAVITRDNTGAIATVSLVLSQSNLDILQEQLKTGRAIGGSAGHVNTMIKVLPVEFQEHPVVFSVDAETNESAEANGCLGERQGWDYKP